MQYADYWECIYFCDFLKEENFTKNVAFLCSEIGYCGKMKLHLVMKMSSPKELSCSTTKPNKMTPGSNEVSDQPGQSLLSTRRKLGS